MPTLLLTIAAEQIAPEINTAVHQALPPNFTLLHSSDEATIRQAAPDIEIVAGWFKQGWLQDLPNLRWLQQWGAGANWILDNEVLRQRPFTLSNVSGVHAIPISEHIFATLLSLGRNLRHAHDAQKANIWAPHKHPTENIQNIPYAFTGDNIFELAHKTMLLIGVGAIGERTAKLAQAFDMHVIGVRQNPDRSSIHVNQIVSPQQLHTVLPQADFVVITAPLTPTTHHLIGQAELDAMKPSAILVNIGRGQIIDEAALLPALQNKRIAAAALDVFEQEPLPANSPFWTLDNLLITSHYAGSTPRYHERAFAIFLDNLGRYQRGEPLRNIVDKQLGY